MLNSFSYPGRFSNHLIRNLCFSILAKKYNFKFEYSYYNEIKSLGIDLYIDGKRDKYENYVIVDDTNFFKFINNEENELDYLLLFNHDTYCQTKEFVLYLKDYFTQNNIFKNIVDKNFYKERYKNNNDVFIHVRLGDVPQFNPGFEYYDKVLSGLKFDNGYISSDTIEHEICKKLIKKYNLKIINFSEVETFQFASTCKHIVLSNGTFSWFIGFLGIYSNVYYPEIKKVWHGDIFVFPEWNKVN